MLFTYVIFQPTISYAHNQQYEINVFPQHNMNYCYELKFY
jgi:hypothetical protein